MEVLALMGLMLPPAQTGNGPHGPSALLHTPLQKVAVCFLYHSALLLASSELYYHWRWGWGHVRFEGAV